MMFRRKGRQIHKLLGRPLSRTRQMRHQPYDRFDRIYEGLKDIEISFPHETAAGKNGEAMSLRMPNLRNWFPGAKIKPSAASPMARRTLAGGEEFFELEPPVMSRGRVPTRHMAGVC